VFLDEIDKVCKRGESSGPDVSREGVQRDLLPLVEGCTVNTKHGMVKTDHILFIASGAFQIAKPSDLIPELQGRFPDSDLAANLVYTPFPDDGTDVSVKLDAFPAVFAGGIDLATAEVLAVSQRPLAGLAFAEAAPAAAWKTKPGWGIVSSADHGGTCASACASPTVSSSAPRASRPTNSRASRSSTASPARCRSDISRSGCRVNRSSACAASAPRMSCAWASSRARSSR
jgi:hypothetical protein